MRFAALIIILAQVLLSGAALLLSIWAGMPWAASAAIGLLAVGALVATRVRPTPWGARLGGWGVAGAWGCTLIVFVSVLLAKGARATMSNYFDGYYVTLAWIIATALWLASCVSVNAAWRTRWRWLTMAWLMLGALLWLGASYLRDRPGTFFLGLLIVLGLLVLCHFWFYLPAPGILAVNTLILLVVGLPIADLVVRGVDWLRAIPDARNQYYLYATARKNPVAFGRWWNYYLGQWRRAEKRLHIRDSALGYRLRSNTRVRFGQDTVSINSLGFRGKEIPRDKANAYRIVALGASTTFGITLTADDQPWPELLEQMIRERLKLPRPVEVINAGVPGYRLDQNLKRFRSDILPLKPDMIISYHGINGFDLLKAALPPFVGTLPPIYKERPLRLLADVEYHFKLMGFQHRPTPRFISPSAPLADPMATPYAKLYEELVAIAATNHIRLVLATHSMAINEQSEPDVVKFFQTGFPRAAWQAQANTLHSAMLRQIAAQHPEVCLVDTHPHLDGEHDKFVDLVHLDPAGHRQLAETFFAALKPLLERLATKSPFGPDAGGS